MAAPNLKQQSKVLGLSPSKRPLEHTWSGIKFQMKIDPEARQKCGLDPDARGDIRISQNQAGGQQPPGPPKKTFLGPKKKTTHVTFGIDSCLRPSALRALTLFLLPLAPLGGGGWGGGEGGTFSWPDRGHAKAYPTCLPGGWYRTAFEFRGLH